MVQIWPILILALNNQEYDKKFNHYVDTNYTIKLLRTVYVKIIEVLIK